MRYWLDTEFLEDGRTISLISIGIVAEDGREFYGVDADYDLSRSSPWLIEHVHPHLGDIALPRDRLREAVLAFFSPAPTEIWADFGEYDWIALRQLVGQMLDWPQGWPLSHMNLEQYRLVSGSPSLPEQRTTRHHALEDARWCREAWDFLRARSA